MKSLLTYLSDMKKAQPGPPPGPKPSVYGPNVRWDPQRHHWVLPEDQPREGSSPTSEQGVRKPLVSPQGGEQVSEKPSSSESNSQARFVDDPFGGSTDRPKKNIWKNGNAARRAV